MSTNSKNPISEINRCNWDYTDPILMEYHDKEWGVKVHDDTKLFEFIVLEGAQAGLNWLTILKRRNSYREAFDNFDFRKVANYDKEKIERLIENSGIIRNKLKIESAITNAQAIIRIKEEFESFDQYLWNFVGNKPIKNSWRNISEIPARCKESDAMSKDLAKRGFKFVGPVICYAHMQATGMVNDHVTTCFRYSEV